MKEEVDVHRRRHQEVTGEVHSINNEGDDDVFVHQDSVPAVAPTSASLTPQQRQPQNHDTDDNNRFYEVVDDAASTLGSNQYSREALESTYYSGISDGTTAAIPAIEAIATIAAAASLPYNGEEEERKTAEALDQEEKEEIAAAIAASLDTIIQDQVVVNDQYIGMADLYYHDQHQHQMVMAEAMPPTSTSTTTPMIVETTNADDVHIGYSRTTTTMMMARGETVASEATTFPYYSATAAAAYSGRDDYDDDDDEDDDNSNRMRVGNADDDDAELRALKRAAYGGGGGGGVRASSSERILYEPEPPQRTRRSGNRHIRHCDPGDQAEQEATVVSITEEGDIHPSDPSAIQVMQEAELIREEEASYACATAAAAAAAATASAATPSLNAASSSVAAAASAACWYDNEDDHEDQNRGGDNASEVFVGASASAISAAGYWGEVEPPPPPAMATASASSASRRPPAEATVIDRIPPWKDVNPPREAQVIEDHQEQQMDTSHLDRKRPAATMAEALPMQQEDEEDWRRQRQSQQHENGVAVRLAGPRHCDNEEYDYCGDNDERHDVDILYSQQSTSSVVGVAVADEVAEVVGIQEEIHPSDLANHNGEAAAQAELVATAGIQEAIHPSDSGNHNVEGAATAELVATAGIHEEIHPSTDPMNNHNVGEAAAQAELVATADDYDGSAAAVAVATTTAQEDYLEEAAATTAMQDDGMVAATAAAFYDGAAETSEVVVTTEYGSAVGFATQDDQHHQPQATTAATNVENSDNIEVVAEPFGHATLVATAADAQSASLSSMALHDPSEPAARATLVLGSSVGVDGSSGSAHAFSATSVATASTISVDGGGAGAGCGDEYEDDAALNCCAPTATVLSAGDETADPNMVAAPLKTIDEPMTPRQSVDPPVPPPPTTSTTARRQHARSANEEMTEAGETSGRGNARTDDDAGEGDEEEGAPEWLRDVSSSTTESAHPATHNVATPQQQSIGRTASDRTTSFTSDRSSASSQRMGIDALSNNIARSTTTVMEALFGNSSPQFGHRRSRVTRDEAAGSVAPRRLLPWSVIFSPTTGMWVATLQTNQKALDRNNVTEASQSLRAFSLPTEKQAICLARAWTPPRMLSFSEHRVCCICLAKFALFRRSHHCRNCGVCVCKECTVQWPAKMIPETYNRKKENFVHVCKSCDWLCHEFRLALLAGNRDKTIALHSTGNLNLHAPFANVKGELFFPVHCAVLGGSLELLKWLVDSHCCPIKSVRVSLSSRDSKYTPIVTSKGRSLLGIAMEGGNVHIVRYLVVEKGVSLAGEKDITTEMLLRNLDSTLRLLPANSTSPPEESSNASHLPRQPSLPQHSFTVPGDGSHDDENRPPMATESTDGRPLAPDNETSASALPEQQRPDSVTAADVRTLSQEAGDFGRLESFADRTDECIICFDRTIDCVATPCGHQICCLQCSEHISKCPVCAADCTFLRVFKR